MNKNFVQRLAGTAAWAVGCFEEQAARIASLEADNAALRGALSLAHRWVGDYGDPNSHFEDIASWFYRETGMLRPGKSQPAAFNNSPTDAERQAAWDEWRDGKHREVCAALSRPCGDEYRAAKALAEACLAEENAEIAWRTHKSTCPAWASSLGIADDSCCAMTMDARDAAGHAQLDALDAYREAMAKEKHDDGTI